MIKVQVPGTCPDELRAAIQAAGGAVVDDGEVAVVWHDEAASRRLRTLSSAGVPSLAIVESEDDLREALKAGATSGLVGLPDADTLGLHLGALRRLSATWSRLSAQQRRAQRALDDLASTQDLLGRLIDATPNPVMAADLHGKVLVFNRAAESALGYEARWAREHMHVTDVYADPTDARRVLGEIRAAGSGIVTALEVQLRARWGEHIPVALSAAEVHDADGRPMATVGVFADMREQLSLADRLEETTEQLIASEKRAAAIEIAGATAHELNQPLTAVMGSLELLELRTDLSPEVRERLQRTYRQLERMGEIVRALARTSRAPSGRYARPSSLLDLARDTD